MASEIINSGLYSLVDLNNVFLDGSNEAIWQLPTDGGQFYQTTEAETFVPYSNDVIPTYQITNNILDSFETGDNRRANWIGTNVVNGTAYYFPYKYKNITADATPAEGYVVFRLAEQYLIRAEALARQNKLDSALSDLNMIRNRAGLANSTASSQAQIISAVMHENQIEFFCEWGHRWFDLKRSGEIDAVLSKIKPGWQPDAALLPIPQQEMQNDPYLTQNPGY